eukprot:2634673-Rhodomonas_salina.1
MPMLVHSISRQILVNAMRSAKLASVMTWGPLSRRTKRPATTGPPRGEHCRWRRRLQQQSAALQPRGSHLVGSFGLGRSASLLMMCVE